MSSCMLVLYVQGIGDIFKVPHTQVGMQVTDILCFFFKKNVYLIFNPGGHKEKFLALTNQDSRFSSFIHGIRFKLSLVNLGIYSNDFTISYQISRIGDYDCIRGQESDVYYRQVSSCCTSFLIYEMPRVRQVACRMYIKQRNI